MSAFQWTLDILDYARSLSDKNNPLNSLANICSVLPQRLHAITLAFATMSPISLQNPYCATKLFDDFGVKYEQGTFLIFWDSLLWHTNHTIEGNNSICCNGCVITGTGYVSSNCSLAYVSFSRFISLYILRNQTQYIYLCGF